jgi:uncharacterized protein
VSLLDELVAGLRSSAGVAAKQDLSRVLDALGNAAPAPRGSVLLGDDCAAIPDADGWLLLAIEGFINRFVEREPWFAGWCGVMVNLSDITAMGGRAIAVVDALWSRTDTCGRAVLEGMAAASRAYGVPVVGGHGNLRCEREQLAVSILGRAKRLLTSFDARPGDVLVAAIDLRGRYREAFPHWDAATQADPARLRGDLEILPRLAEDGLCCAAKDISQAGLLGTALMLLECSGVGGVINIEAAPRPDATDASRWLLQTFPSYGYLLAVAPQHLPAVRQRFQARGIACAAIGECDATRVLRLRDGAREVPAWDLSRTVLTGCGPREPARLEAACA